MGFMYTFSVTSLGPYFSILFKYLLTYMVVFFSSIIQTTFLVSQCPQKSWMYWQDIGALSVSTGYIVKQTSKKYIQKNDFFLKTQKAFI